MGSFFALLLPIAGSDLKYRRIPDKLICALFFVGMVSAFTMPEIELPSRIAGIFAASLPLFLTAMAARGALGGGDIKLMAAAGMFLGAKLVVSALFLGILTGGMYAGISLLRKKKGRKDRFALGPFLCIGIAGAYFWGELLW